jgi:hypothetical protein
MAMAMRASGDLKPKAMRVMSPDLGVLVRNVSPDPNGRGLRAGWRV